MGAVSEKQSPVVRTLAFRFAEPLIGYSTNRSAYRSVYNPSSGPAPQLLLPKVANSQTDNTYPLRELPECGNKFTRWNPSPLPNP